MSKKAFSNNRKKIGIEHIKKELLKSSINNEVLEVKDNKGLNMGDLVYLGLAGGINSAENRIFISSKLRIGHANAKTLLQRLNWLGITIEELEDILNETSS